MSKKRIYNKLIKACKNKNGGLNLFTQHCLKGPLKFFKNKNLEKEYLSLDPEEQSIFSNAEKFFGLLVQLGFKKLDDNNVQNLNPYCRNCNKPVPFINLGFGYKGFCCDKCRSEHKSKIQSVIEFNRSKEEKDIISKKRSNAYTALSESSKKERRRKQSVAHNKRSLSEKKIIANKVRKTMESKGAWLSKEYKTDFELYRMEVSKCTNRSVYNHYHQIEGISKRSLEYPLDHIFSIKEGFENNILPWVIGHYKNLRIITRSENSSKNYRSSISKEDLFNLVD